MKIRTVFGLVALAAGLIGGSVANAATCVNEFTGAVLPANVVGTGANERFGPNEPLPRKLRDNDVVQTLGGNDIVDVQGLEGLTICLGGGTDQVINSSQAKGGISVRAKAGNDTVNGTPFQDAVNGGEGFDVFIDPFVGDGDICRKFETVINCEDGSRPPDGIEEPE